MELKPRLAAVAALVPACHCMADIGTDHAYVPMDLVRKHRVEHAVASDIHKGPLDIARRHIGKTDFPSGLKPGWEAGWKLCSPGNVKA